MATYFNNLLVKIDSHVDVNQPDMTSKNDFYKIYSPKAFTLKPREDIYLDLKIKITAPDVLEPWINLLPHLKGAGLKSEENDWVTNRTKGNTIQLHILNKSFQRTVKIKNKQCIAFAFLLGQKYNDKITTEYTNFT